MSHQIRQDRSVVEDLQVLVKSEVPEMTFVEEHHDNLRGRDIAGQQRTIPHTGTVESPCNIRPRPLRPRAVPGCNDPPGDVGSEVIYQMEKFAGEMWISSSSCRVIAKHLDLQEQRGEDTTAAVVERNNMSNSVTEGGHNHGERVARGLDHSDKRCAINDPL